MNDGGVSPKRLANDLSKLLNAAFGSDRFPVDVKQLARDYSLQRFPEDPISLIKGDSLPGFDGALYCAPPGKKGWGIIYNTDIASAGRINFTLAHEFGHYLLHRAAYPDGIECSAQGMVDWSSEYGQVEQQANEFAATLLMPLDDFRRHIDAKVAPSLDDLSWCAERYQVSLLAAIRRWIDYTERRSVLVVSRDGFVLWARSSKRAYKSGAYFKTAGMPPVPIPDASIPAELGLYGRPQGTIQHEACVWFSEPCIEVSLISDQYDFAISLLHLGDEENAYEEVDEASEIDVSEGMRRRNPGSSWLD